jgi:hypothetical protein
MTRLLLLEQIIVSKGNSSSYPSRNGIGAVSFFIKIKKNAKHIEKMPIFARLFCNLKLRITKY